MIPAWLAALLIVAAILTAEIHGRIVGYRRGHKAGRDRGFALAWRRLSTAQRTRRASLRELAGAVLVGADGITPVRKTDRADEARTDGAGGAR